MTPASTPCSCEAIHKLHPRAERARAEPSTPCRRKRSSAVNQSHLPSHQWRPTNTTRPRRRQREPQASYCCCHIDNAALAAALIAACNCHAATAKDMMSTEQHHRTETQNTAPKECKRGECTRWDCCAMGANHTNTPGNHTVKIACRRTETEIPQRRRIAHNGNVLRWARTPQTTTPISRQEKNCRKRQMCQENNTLLVERQTRRTRFRQ